MTKSSSRWLFLAAAVMAGGAGHAHHSTAIYDQSRLITIAGVVKEFSFKNPHTTITLLVPVEAGKPPQEWHLIGGGTNSLLRYGWKRDTLTAGKRAKFIIAPMKDGQPGGDFKALLEVDGEKVDIRSGTFHDK